MGSNRFYAAFITQCIIVNSICTLVSNHPDNLLSSGSPNDLGGLNLHWMFKENLSRHKRSPVEKSSIKFEDQKCQNDFTKLCGSMEEDNDLAILECVQNFKTSEISKIDNKCQHMIWARIVNTTKNENMQRLMREICGADVDKLNCPNTKPGSYLSCVIERREVLKDSQCLDYVQRLEWIAFSDFSIITPFAQDCHRDIERLSCGRLQLNREISQGQTLACLQQNVEQLETTCRKHIFRVSEVQAENIKLDRQLFLSCSDDYLRFCPNVRQGSGLMYKCLMQHKFDRSMSRSCQDQLTRREKLIASDYRVSKGLVRACKEDIKNNHCRRLVSDDREIKLAQILLCLEAAMTNGTKIAPNCQTEMFDHRKILMEDYRLSPEIVNGCANDITTYCNGLEVGGVTIHCLMEHARSRQRRFRLSSECQVALESLVKETNLGEDWRVDPVLREACQPVVDLSCRDVRGGNARVISCLMDKIGSDKMTEACETALVQIQYFVARDFKLDPQLYRACKSDAAFFCHARSSWINEGFQMDPDMGPLILPCLYRYAHHPQKNMTLRRDCSEEVRRVMRQRAISVDLQPEIEELCLDDLASFCYDKTAVGEEILCLQDNLESLKNDCKLAVGNVTEEQSERVELNPVIMASCRNIMERHCQDILKFGKDEGDMMECLIEHKNEFDSRSDYKCKAAVEHFQLISLKNYHFTFKFKEACRPHVLRLCPKAKSKADVIECLSSHMKDDIIKDAKHRISKECRQQLRAQLYQQRENIHFDPILQTTCAKDIKKMCFNIEPGNSQILECLATNKIYLEGPCHKLLFKVRKQEFQDSSSDFALLNTCATMIRQFCHDIDRSQALDCLKKHKDKPSFDEKCKKFVIKRMIEQNTDYRFNTALQKGCTPDIDRHCKEVLLNQPLDKELEGKVIKCLKIKFRESKLTTKCEYQMANILREAALNYHLNPLLATLCAYEIETICQADENDPATVEECLKSEFNNDNKNMKEECRMQVADLVEEARADINVDPLLQKACAIDVNKYCSHVAQGAGRHIKCLQDNKDSLQLDCYKMLTTRMEMFKNAAKLLAPNNVQELYDSLNRSPARKFFLVVAFLMVCCTFAIGLFCGRITRRTMMMKNK